MLIICAKNAGKSLNTMVLIGLFMDVSKKRTMMKAFIEILGTVL